MYAVKPRVKKFWNAEVEDVEDVCTALYQTAFESLPGNPPAFEPKKPEPQTAGTETLRDKVYASASS